MATILIVDDEPDIVGLLRARLENHGYAVHGARDGVEALQVVRHEAGQVDLVITGIGMPRMNGFELGGQLRVEYPKLPVIYMSAHVSDDVVKQACELQLTGLPEDCAFLPQPVLKKNCFVSCGRFWPQKKRMTKGGADWVRGGRHESGVRRFLGGPD